MRRRSVPAVAATGSLATIFQSHDLRYCITCRWLAWTRRSAFWLIMPVSPSALARPAMSPIRSMTRSHLINRADHYARFDRSAIFHHHARQNTCGRRRKLVRETISIDLDNGLTNADRIANALEPSPDSQARRGTCNLRYLYFRALCFVHFFTFGQS